jgi:hypothetical protein
MWNLIPQIKPKTSHFREKKGPTLRPWVPNKHPQFRWLVLTKTIKVGLSMKQVVSNTKLTFFKMRIVAFSKRTGYFRSRNGLWSQKMRVLTKKTAEFIKKAALLNTRTAFFRMIQIFNWEPTVPSPIKIAKFPKKAPKTGIKVRSSTSSTIRKVVLQIKS